MKIVTKKCFVLNCVKLSKLHATFLSCNLQPYSCMYYISQYVLQVRFPICSAKTSRYLTITILFRKIVQQILSDRYNGEILIFFMVMVDLVEKKFAILSRKTVLLFIFLM